ncbi:hypothetical protein TWF718_009167 [Orbilia javanica]|uniref:Fibronectin type-III domain-containing protein n=1 Tax=Orbilia javanica TaxID=47235 RepID=A0AAN8RMB1_9PEZI
MGGDPDDTVLSRSALGQNIQLGMLYDARSSQTFASISLWDNDFVNAKQEITEETVEHADFTTSCSLEEAQKDNSFDAEGSLTLNSGVGGSLKYANGKKSSTYEARVDVSCTIVRRTRRIPQEALASMKYEKHLNYPHYTHFVAEVSEGGHATLSFIRPCSSAEEVKEVTGRLKMSILKTPVQGGASYLKKEEFKFEDLKVLYNGAIVESVSSLQDARRVSHEMPKKLANQLNALRYTLLPLAVLDSTANRLIRSLDDNLVSKTDMALKAGTEVDRKLGDLIEKEVFRKQFPAIRSQILNFRDAFSAAEDKFREDARRLLPELRDGTTDGNEKGAQLQASVALFERCTRFAERFISYKETESSVLCATVIKLLGMGFENCPGGLTDSGALRLLLAFGGNSIGCAKHPLQVRIESTSSGSSAGGGGGGGRAKDESGTESEDDTGSEDDSSYEAEEWFEDEQTVTNLKQSCEDLRQHRLLAGPDVAISFGVAQIKKAYRPGTNKVTSPRVGDIALVKPGKRSTFVVTGMLPKAPEAPILAIEGQTMTVKWSLEREGPGQLVMPTIGFTVKYRPQPDSPHEVAIPRIYGNEAPIEVDYEASETSAVIDSLLDDCNYEVAISIRTIIGASPWSASTVCRTGKLPSVAETMVDFFNRNKGSLSKLDTKGPQGSRPWDLCIPDGSNKGTLFLGLTEVAQRTSTDQRFLGKIAVRIVDVAAEFKPEIAASPIEDPDKTVVAVFVGTTGHGKSTQINAFISYLLGGGPDDPVRILAIDDRGAEQSSSVTQIVTCFRIRPLSSEFQGKTVLIVDTPGYGDTRGIEYDAFVTAAMSEFFMTVSHVNAIIFTCRASEMRTTLLTPVSAYVFSLFAKDVHSCLRTIYTFGDAGAPPARDALIKIEWPVCNGEIVVNNSVFTINLDGGGDNAAVRGGWLQSVRDQSKVMQMLLRATSVPTKSSALVTRNRITLERRCELAEKKILCTANEAQILIAQLSTLARAVGAAPGDKIELTENRAVEKPLPPGLSTTLCIECTHTCHPLCAFSEDKDKESCYAMDFDGNCTQCKGHCNWQRHRNAQFIIIMEKHSEWVVPKELIQRWNKNNNTLEGALIAAMDAYLRLQEDLHSDILELAKLSEQLTSMALLHNPKSLISYIDMLIRVSRTIGASPEQLMQLVTAKNTLLILCEVRAKGKGATRDSEILLSVIRGVREEMFRRMRLSDQERAEEETKPCMLYNDLLQRLPADFRRKAPRPLREAGMYSRAPLYPENLQAIVQLVQVVLQDGGVVAALAHSTSPTSAPLALSWKDG